jgi:hypothetical protein
MVRVNFSWILAGLIVAAAGVWIGSLSAQTAAQAAQDRYYETRQQVEKIVQLRRDWEGDTQARKRIERLLASKRYKQLGEVIKDDESIRANLDNLDATALNNLLHPLLQSPVVVKGLEVNRKEQSSVSLRLELAP